MNFYNNTSHYVNIHDLTTVGPQSLEAAGFTASQRERLAHYCGVRTASDAVDLPDRSILAVPGIGRQLLRRLRAAVWAQ